MPDIRLIAIDLDGTLLTDDKQVCGSACEALQRAAAKGIKVVIASARPPRSVRAFYHQLGLDTWQINYNGAMIWDERSQKVVSHQPMAGETVLKLVRRARDLHADVQVECEILDRWHTDRRDHRFSTGTGKLFKPDVYADLATICSQPITVFNLLGEPEEIDRIEPILIAEAGVEVEIVRAGDDDLLIGHHPAACKSVALETVAAHYDVPLSQTLAIGDAANDIRMLQMAGYSAAMGNASARVKSAAKWIAPTNADRGVQAALHYFLPNLR